MVSRVTFGAHALLTRVIPGAVASVVFYLTPFTTFVPNPLQAVFSSNVNFIAFVALAFFIGEIIDLGRTMVHPVPYPFRRLLFYETDDERFLSLSQYFYLKTNEQVWDPIKEKFSGMGSDWKQKLPDSVKRVPGPSSQKNSSDHEEWSESFYYGFVEEFEERFAMSVEERGARGTYEMIDSYVGQHLSPEAQRYRRSMHFFVNMILALAFALFIAMYSILASLFGGLQLPQGPLLSAILTAITVPGVLYLAIPLMTISERRFVQKLLAEYFVVRTAEDT